MKRYKIEQIREHIFYIYYKLNWFSEWNLYTRAGSNYLSFSTFIEADQTVKELLNQDFFMENYMKNKNINKKVWYYS